MYIYHLHKSCKHSDLKCEAWIATRRFGAYLTSGVDRCVIQSQPRGRNLPLFLFSSSPSRQSTIMDVQSITITSTQTVPQPKPHTTYTIQGDFAVTRLACARLCPSADIQSRRPRGHGRYRGDTMTLSLCIPNSKHRREKSLQEHCRGSITGQSPVACTMTRCASPTSPCR